MGPTLPTLRTDYLTGTLTGQHGLYEHALLDRPRRSLGYTTDDNARALVVLCRAFPESDIGLYLDFVVGGRVPGGWHNRMTDQGWWADVHGSDDAHGRAIWGLGCAYRWRDSNHARAALISGLDLNSPHPRANAYAALGAAEAMEAEPALPGLESFLRRIASRLPRVSSHGWEWPEPRLTYDNARIPLALMMAGRALENDALIDDGLHLLGWLVQVEHTGAGFSFTSPDGRDPTGPGPKFDQQPIEAWAMADACLLAAEIDGHDRWEAPLEDAAMWILGRNATGAALYDPHTGAGFDGLEPSGVNLNRGAESTLAALGALDALRRYQGSTVA
jgi:hypothetical protein